MSFSEKLKRLMQVQGTSNSKIARALSVDPSLVSRWKSGSRVPPKNSAYFELLVAYFIRNAKMDYQKSALSEIIGLPEVPDSDDALSDQLQRWLLEETPVSDIQITQFINKFAQAAPIENLGPTSMPTFSKGKPFFSESYRGHTGFKQAILRFLTEIAQSNTPTTLRLYSDLPMTWLSEDMHFAQAWAAALKAVIAGGHRIQIVHTIQRDLREMLFAIEQWMPLYMSGVIEPFYDPNFKKPIFNRTLFIAPQIAAVTSTAFSNAHASNRSHYFYITDPVHIADYIKEFDQYLEKCMPLMHIFTGERISKDLDPYLKIHNAIPKHHIVLTDRPSMETVPLSAVKQLTLPVAQQNALINHITTFNQHLKVAPYTEILYLAKDDSIPHHAPHHFVQTPDAKAFYRAHLKHLIHLLETQPNYTLYLIDALSVPPMYLSFNGADNIVIIKNAPKATAFGFNQPQMVDAFKRYLMQMIASIPAQFKERHVTIDRLHELLSSL